METTTILMFCQSIVQMPVPEYGQLVKIRENGRVVRKEKRIIYGNPDLGDIETTNVENYNGILRERIGRLVRKTKCFSKRKADAGYVRSNRSNSIGIS